METFTLKTKIIDDKVVSRGIAIVQYQTKDEAAEAMKKLPFDRKLGDFIQIDFYQSKESRMMNIEKQNNPINFVQTQLQMPTLVNQKAKPMKKKPVATKAVSPPKEVQVAAEKRQASRSKSKPSSQPRYQIKGTQAALEEKKAQEKKVQKGGGSKNSSTSPNRKPAPPSVAAQMPKPVPVVPVKEVLYDKLPMDQYNQLGSELEKKQFLGNYLYQFVMKYLTELAHEDIEGTSGKITGMILDGQTVDCVLYLFSDKQAF